jgi:Leucine-rich repeat (LRR) protein
LANLEECRVYNCGLKDLIIENCPRLNSLIIGNNLLTNLDFVKNLPNLINLDIDGNERISIGIERLPDNLKEFSCEGTELFEVLESHNGD